MGGQNDCDEMRLFQETWRRQRQCRLSRQPTKRAFLINVLILMALIRDIEAIAIHAHSPHNAPHNSPNNSPLGHSVSVRDSTKEDTYQNNYEDDAATVAAAAASASVGLSTGYTMAHNYYRSAAAGRNDGADETSTYGDMQRFRFRDANDRGFIPNAMTADGQHFVAGVEQHTTRQNVVSPPQIGGIRATGQYTMPEGKIDYEINMANYDVAATAATAAAVGEMENGIKADGQNTGVIETNDAYNIASLQDITRLQQEEQQKLQQQQNHEQHQQLAYAEQQQQQRQQYYVNEMIAFKNYAIPTKSTYNMHTNVAHQQQHQQQQHPYQHQQTNSNEQYLHNLQILQYANYDEKSEEAAHIRSSNEKILGNDDGSKHQSPSFSFMSYEQPGSRNIFHLNRRTKELQNYEPNPSQWQWQQHQQRQSHLQHPQHESDDNLKSSSQRFYPQSSTQPTVDDRSLNIQDVQPSYDTTSTASRHHQSPFPPITQSFQHIKHIPVPVPVQIQRQHIPYNKTVPIEVPHPVITTVSKPIPINVPVSQTVTVPQLQVLRIPIERVKPMPVERDIPFFVEKRVPYQVEKHIAKPVFYPYPIRVPIVTTIVHKMPHNSYHYQNFGHPYPSHNHRSSSYSPHPARHQLYTQAIPKNSLFG